MTSPATSSFSWLTPAAPAAIAVVRVPALGMLLDRAMPIIGAARFARLIAPDGTVVDELVVDRISAEAMHLMPHGGPGMRAAVDACLRAHGLKPAAPGPGLALGLSLSLSLGLEAQWAALAAAPAPAAVAWLLANPGVVPPFNVDFLRRTPIILITGPANAGKSTLLNAWCGHQRALVSDLPGTTRDVLTAETCVGGWRLRLLDSAGLRSTADPLEQAGQALVEGARARADVILSLRPPDDDVPEVPTDLVVFGKADRRPLGTGLRWTAHDPESGLANLGAAVLQRLGLPAMTTG